MAGFHAVGGEYDFSLNLGPVSGAHMHTGLDHTSYVTLRWHAHQLELTWAEAIHLESLLLSALSRKETAA